MSANPNHIGPLTGPLSVTSESEYLALWKAHEPSDLTPQNIASTGGMLADRMSWAFIAGYQAAIYWVFGESIHLQGKRGWSAFTSSEDRKTKDPLPGVTGVITNDNFVITGNKTWAAACDSIESLIVKVGSGESASYWFVPANSRGVSINSYTAPRRLPEMSQGVVNFDKVELPVSFQLDDSRVRFFHLAEAYHLLVSLTASLWNQSTHYNYVDICDRCIGLSKDLQGMRHSLQEKTFKLQFSKLHDDVLDTFKAYVDQAGPEQSELWQRDISILMMYAIK